MKRCVDEYNTFGRQQKIKRNLINVIDNPRHTFGLAKFYNIHVCLEADAVSIDDLKRILNNISHGSFEHTILSLLDNIKDNLSSFKIKFIFDNSYGFELSHSIESNSCFEFTNLFLSEGEIKTIKLDYDDYVWDIINLLSTLKNVLKSVCEDTDTVLERLIVLLVNSLSSNEIELTTHNDKIHRETLMDIHTS